MTLTVCSLLGRVAPYRDSGCPVFTFSYVCVYILYIHVFTNLAPEGALFLLDSIHSMSFLSPTEEIQKQPVTPGACTLGTRVTASLAAPDPRSQGPGMVGPGKGALPCV